MLKGIAEERLMHQQNGNEGEVIVGNLQAAGENRKMKTYTVGRKSKRTIHKWISMMIQKVMETE